MKYLYFTYADPARAIENRLVPVDDILHIVQENGIYYLAKGKYLLIDVDEHNKTELIPFIANAFNNTDVVSVNLTGSGTYPRKELI